MPLACPAAQAFLVHGLNLVAYSVLEQPKCAAFTRHLARTRGHIGDVSKEHKGQPGAAAPSAGTLPLRAPAPKQAGPCANQAATAAAVWPGLECMPAKLHAAKHLPDGDGLRDLEASRPLNALASQTLQPKKALAYVSALRKQDVSLLAWIVQAHHGIILNKAYQGEQYWEH